MTMDLVAVSNKEVELSAVLEPLIDSMGFELVRLRISGRHNPVLQILAERRKGGMNVDDCADLSRALSALLEVEDPIATNYTLEVSSPGIDRPLTRTEHLEAWMGHLAKVELARPLDGQRRFRGKLLDSGETELVLDTSTGKVRLPLDGIARAKLLLTDELLAASRPSTHE